MICKASKTAPMATAISKAPYGITQRYDGIFSSVLSNSSDWPADVMLFTPNVAQAFLKAVVARVQDPTLGIAHGDAAYDRAWHQGASAGLKGIDEPWRYAA